MLILNLIWPALFVIAELWRAWLLILATVAIEFLTIKGVLGYSFQKSFWASLVGNLFSALIGTFLMIWGMVLWHFIFDWFLDGTFNLWNWIATFVLMFLGSIFLEIWAIHYWYGESISKLILPLSIGNFLTYCVIAYTIFWKEKNGKLGERPF